MKTIENKIKNRYYSIQVTTEYEDGLINVGYISEEEYYKQKSAEMMPSDEDIIKNKTFLTKEDE